MRLAIFVCVLVVSSVPAMAVELTGSAAPSAPVPGDCGWGCGSGVSSTIVIPAGVASINDIRCSVNVQGTGGFSSLVPELTSPSGQTVTLSNFNCPGTSSQPVINVTFGPSPNAYDPANLNNGWSFVMDSCPIPGPSMTAFNGLDAEGVWTLTVYRDFQSPTATLVEWELTVSDGQIGQTPVPVNNECSAVILIDDMTTTPFDMTSATSSGVADCMANDEPDIWYRLENAPCQGNYTFSTATSSFATIVTLFDGGGGCPTPGVPPIACGPGTATVALATGDAVYVKVSSAVGATPGAGEIAVTSDTAPVNDDCASPEGVAPVNGSLSFDTTCATDGFTQTCSAGPASTWPLADVWYLVTADCDGTMTLDTFGSSYDTAIAVWPAAACPTGPAPFCNDDAMNPPAGQNNRSELTIPILDGDVFLVQIGGGVLGARGAGVLNFTFDCPQTDSDFLRGNCNNDASINIADAVFKLSVLFPPMGMSAPVPDCFDACDSNDDGQLNIADAVFTLSVLFPPMGQVPPTFAAPTVGCGQDPTADMLDCAAYDVVAGCP